MSNFPSWCTFFVFNSAWQLLVLVAVTALLVRVSNGLQYRLWVGCLMLAVTLPVISTYLALAPVHSSTSAAQADHANRWKVPRQPDRGLLTLHLTEVPITHSKWTLFGTITGLYVACFAFGLGRLLLRLERTRRIVARKSPLAFELADFDVLNNRLTNHKRPVEVFASSELEGPATVTWPQPMILLPPAFELMSESEQAAAVAHELAHVQRRL